MDERVIQFRVGVMVIASMIICAILVVLNGDFRLASWFEERTTVHVVFDSAPGVVADTPVRKNGILIGRVVNVEHVEPTGARVTMEIDQTDGRVRHKEICQISSSLLGDAVLEFVPGPEGGSNELVEQGDQLKGRIKSNPLDVITSMEDDLQGALNSIQEAGTEVSKLANRLNSAFGEDKDVTELMNNTNEAMLSFKKTMDSINQVLTEEEVKDLRQSIGKLPQLLADTQKTLSGIQDVAQMAHKNLQNLEGFTEPLNRRGESIVANIDHSVEQLDEVLGELAKFGQTLNSRKGTLGQLVNNPDIYHKIDRAATNIEHLTRQLRPILRDVRILSDKVSRDPGGEIGLRSVFRRSNGIK